MSYVITRTTGRLGLWKDRLAGWDVIWGPAWSNGRAVLRFQTEADARDALAAAQAIVAPVPWVTPGYGVTTQYQIERV